jgi:hypothetical protein
MAPLPKLDEKFLAALREFANYFTTKLNDLSMITGHNTKGFSTSNATYNSFKHLSTAIEMEQFSASDFLLFTLKAFRKFASYDFINSSIHTNKDNFCIVNLLSQLLVFDLNIGGKILTSEETDELRIIHSKLFSVFNFKPQLQTTENVLNQQIRSTDSNSKSYSQRKINHIILENQEANTVKRHLNKKLRYENHLCIFNIHKNNKTTPNSLFFNRFPSPFLEHDQEFVDKYNGLIEDTQNKIINLIITTLEERLIKIDSQIIEKRDLLDEQLKQIGSDFESFIDVITFEEEKNLVGKFASMKYRAERCKQIKFQVLTKNDINNSHAITSSSLNNSYASSFKSSHKRASSIHNYDFSKQNANKYNNRQSFRYNLEEKNYGANNYNRNNWRQRNNNISARNNNYYNRSRLDQHFDSNNFNQERNFRRVQFTNQQK